MGLFKRKPKVTIEEFCQQFYNTTIFDANGAVIEGLDLWKVFCETAFDQVVQADESFAAIDRIKFQEELTAMEMELFALAWMRRFRREEFTLPQSLFTRCYLEGNLPIWDAMGEYNQAVAQSTAMTETGQQGSAAQAVRGNQLRFGMFYRWSHTVPDGLTPELKEEAGRCVARVANRIGADIQRGDCVLVRLLASRLADRLRCRANLNPDALLHLYAVIYGFYRGAKEAINEANLARL